MTGTFILWCLLGMRPLLCGEYRSLERCELAAPGIVGLVAQWENGGRPVRWVCEERQ